MPDLLKSVEDGVMKIVLNRPEAMNALSRVMLNDFGAALEEADSSRDIGCVVVRGAGDHARWSYDENCTRESRGAVDATVIRFCFMTEAPRYALALSDAEVDRYRMMAEMARAGMGAFIMPGCARKNKRRA